MRRSERAVLFIACLLTAGTLHGQTRAELYARAFIDATGQLRIVTTGGREILPKKDTDQTGFDKPEISQDGREVAWLALYPNCCTSYPIPLKLMVMSNGRTRTLQGDGFPVWRWSFQSAGARIAFEQETVHGGLGIHYELREVASGRLLAQYSPTVGPDGQPLAVQDPPAWVRDLDAKAQ